jgi:hypothetical protein
MRDICRSYRCLHSRLADNGRERGSLLWVFQWRVGSTAVLF